MAQLAAQHLHSRPQLDRLPVADRAAIARALSKDPQQRFPSCREMVEALRETSPLSAPPAKLGVPPAKPVPPGPRRPAVEAGTRRRRPCRWFSRYRWGAPPPAESAPPAEAAAVRDLPPLAIDPAEIEFRPTVIVGLGGLAASVLKLLRRRLADRFPDENALPALQLLVFDTDPRTLSAVAGEDPQAGLDENSAILLPLRQPADYRADSQRHLQWLSRRWIYNIPRSLQTQGFRPLGRLAFVDHCQRVRERIVRAVKAACDPVGLAASAMAAGMAAGPDFAADLRGFVDFRRQRRRHGARRWLPGPSNPAGAVRRGRRALRNPGPPVGPRPASPRSGRGQHLRLPGRAAPIQRRAGLSGRSLLRSARVRRSGRCPLARPTSCTWARIRRGRLRRGRRQAGEVLVLQRGHAGGHVLRQVPGQCRRRGVLRRRGAASRRSRFLHAGRRRRRAIGRRCGASAFATWAFPATTFPRRPPRSSADCCRPAGGATSPRKPANGPRPCRIRPPCWVPGLPLTSRPRTFGPR